MLDAEQERDHFATGLQRNAVHFELPVQPFGLKEHSSGEQVLPEALDQNRKLALPQALLLLQHIIERLAYALSVNLFQGT
ncbi:hypothetical protein D3C81_1937330 [compost metagenome]